jgi:hypothetical protein
MHPVKVETPPRASVGLHGKRHIGQPSDRFWKFGRQRGQAISLVPEQKRNRNLIGWCALPEPRIEVAWQKRVAGILPVLIISSGMIGAPFPEWRDGSQSDW